MRLCVLQHISAKSDVVGQEQSHPDVILIPNYDDQGQSNSENVDRLNLVILSFSLYCIPTRVILLGQNSPAGGQNWQRQGQPALAGAATILTQLTI
jgi:hypothetical protein